MLTFLAVWVGAAAVLALGGRAQRLPTAAAILGGVLLFSALTWLVTRRAGAVEGDPAPPPRGPRAALQLGWMLLIAGFAVWHGLHFHGLVSQPIPWWHDVVDAAGDLGERIVPAAWFGSDRNALANPVAYMLLPLVGLLLLGARFRSLGFGRGRRVVAASVLLCALPVAWILGNLPGKSLQQVVRALLGNTLQNGPFEEFLYRGALQSRLQAYCGGGHAVVWQAVLFGLCHLGMAMKSGDPWWLAACQTVVNQGTMGVLFGVVTLRTGNLWAASLLHVFSNAAAQLG